MTMYWGPTPTGPVGGVDPTPIKRSFHEPFVLFGFMAGVTQRVEFATGIIILPQRQTALVAKQAAALDVLSGGRLRLGIGIGWNQVEYTALNEQFRNRGKRFEEQIEVLRLLWTEPLVTFEGKYHTIEDAGLNPMPVQRPIPIWFGGHADVVMERVAKWGAGWMPNYRTPQEAAHALETLDQRLAEVGRPRADVGLEPRLSYGSGDADEWARWIDDLARRRCDSRDGQHDGLRLHPARRACGRAASLCRNDASRLCGLT